MGFFTDCLWFTATLITRWRFGLRTSTWSETRDGEEIRKCPAKTRFLAAEVACTFVKNMQREGEEKHLKAVATPKHFLGTESHTIQ